MKKSKVINSLLILTLIALSLCAKGQKQFTNDTLKVSPQRQVGFLSFEQSEKDYIAMSMPDSSIVIHGDTIKLIKACVRYWTEQSRKLESAQLLLSFLEAHPNSDDKAYLKALKQYWKLNNDKRYKLIK